MLAVLVHADEQRGATVKSLSEKLLANYGTISRKLLEFCRGEGLLEENDGQYVLTEHGRDAIKYGRTPVPYSGIWKIHLADDPLVPSEYCLLGIESTEDLEWKDGNPVDRQPEPEKMGSDVMALEGMLLQPSIGKRIDAVRIDKIAACGKELSLDLNVRAIWKIGVKGSGLVLEASTKDGVASANKAFDLLGVKKSMSMEEINDLVRKMILKYNPSKKNHSKKIEAIEEAAEQIRNNYDVIRGEHRSGLAGEKSIRPPSDITCDEIWAMVSKQFQLEWDPKRRCLLATYESVKPNERMDMKVKLKETSLDIERLGRFQTKAVDAPIYPATNGDAKKWAEDHLCKKMEEEYVTLEKYKSLTKMIADRFSDFEIEFGKRILHAPSERTRLFWHIRAMEDWNL